MNPKRREELESFLRKPEIDLIYIYHINPNSPDAALAQVVLEYKRFTSEQAHNSLLSRQNKVLLALTVVLAVAALLQAFISAFPILTAR